MRREGQTLQSERTRARRQVSARACGKHLRTSFNKISEGLHVATTLARQPSHPTYAPRALRALSRVLSATIAAPHVEPLSVKHAAVGQNYPCMLGRQGQMRFTDPRAPHTSTCASRRLKMHPFCAREQHVARFQTVPTTKRLSHAPAGHGTTLCDPTVGQDRRASAPAAPPAPEGPAPVGSFHRLHEPFFAPTEAS